MEITKDTEERLKKIFLASLPDLKPEEFSLTKRQQEYESWDSFAHMQLIAEVEKEFGVTLGVDEVVGIQSAQDILEVLKAK